MIPQTFPLTPPPTDRPKSKYLGSVSVSPVKPKRLLDDLKKVDTTEDITDISTVSKVKNKEIKRNSRGATAHKKLKYLKTNSNSNSVLDINSPIQDPVDLENLESLKDALLNCKNIVVVAGAGISTYAGIPDFRSKDNGLYTSKGRRTQRAQRSSKKEIFDLNYIYSSETATLQFNDMMVYLYNKYKSSPPTPFHHLLDSLASEGRLKRLYTQNIDSLETKLPHLQTVSPLTQATKPYPNLIQLHGSIRMVRCSKCQAVTEMSPELFLTSTDSQATSQAPSSPPSSPYLLPPCTRCQEYAITREAAGLRSTGIGYIRPTVTLFNEVQHPDGEILAEIINYDTKYSTRVKKTRVDCLVIVGTTLAIPAVRKLCLSLASVLRKSKGGPVFFLSNEMPSKAIQRAFEKVGGFDLVVLGDCQKLVSLL